MLSAAAYLHGNGGDEVEAEPEAKGMAAGGEASEVTGMRLGVVGFGKRIAYVINRELKQLEPDLKVAGVVDPDEAGARGRLEAADREAAVFYDGLDEMVGAARLDALCIGTRCHLHAPYAVEAAQYDLPLFLEKPVAISMEQASALEKAFENSRCQVVVSFPLRVSPLCTLARDYLCEGAVGEPEHLLAVNFVPYGTCYFDQQYREFAITQCLFLQKATHDFDYMMYLMGASIARVTAMAARGRVFGGSKPAGLYCSRCDEQETCPESPQSRARNQTISYANVDHPCLFGEDIGTPETGMNEDSSSALVEFSSGAQGVYTQVFFSRRDAGRRGATISGYQGTVSFDWYDNQLRRVRHHRPFSDVSRAGAEMSHFGGDQELARDFLGVIRGKAPSRTPIHTGIQSIYACLAAKQSAETGRWVTVRQVGQAE